MAPEILLKFVAHWSRAMGCELAGLPAAHVLCKGEKRLQPFGRLQTISQRPMVNILRVPFSVFSASLVLSLTACESASGKASTKTEVQYQSYCARCHNVGAANAPRKGDSTAWAKRLRKGESALLQSLKEGVVAMPPKGGCEECSDEDLRALVDYLSH